MSELKDFFPSQSRKVEPMSEPETNRYNGIKSHIQENSMRLEEEFVALKDRLAPFLGPDLKGIIPVDGSEEAPLMSEECALMLGHANHLAVLAEALSDLRRRVFN